MRCVLMFPSLGPRSAVGRSGMAAHPVAGVNSSVLFSGANVEMLSVPPAAKAFAVFEVYPIHRRGCTIRWPASDHVSVLGSYTQVLCRMATVPVQPGVSLQPYPPNVYILPPMKAH